MEMDGAIPLNDIVLGNRSFYFNKKDIRATPSYRDGVSSYLESQYRKDGARFIIELGNKMDLGYNTMATAVVYFHRFYMIHSFNTFPKYLTASSCLFLAGKVEETPKKCKDIIKIAEKILPESEFVKFGTDPKDEMLRLEKMILQTIRFNLLIDHPYGFLLKYAKYLKGDKQRMEKVLQMAWTFVNDSLCTTLSVQWEPEIIAISMIYLAAKLNKYEITDWIGKSNGQKWWDMFVLNLTVELMEDICHQVLDLYSQKRHLEPGTNEFAESKGQHHMAPLKFPSIQDKVSESNLNSSQHASPSIKLEKINVSKHTFEPTLQNGPSFNAEYKKFLSTYNSVG